MMMKNEFMTQKLVDAVDAGYQNTPLIKALKDHGQCGKQRLGKCPVEHRPASATLGHNKWCIFKSMVTSPRMTMLDMLSGFHNSHLHRKHFLTQELTSRHIWWGRPGEMEPCEAHLSRADGNGAVVLRSGLWAVGLHVRLRQVCCYS